MDLKVDLFQKECKGCRCSQCADGIPENGQKKERYICANVPRAALLDKKIYLERGKRLIE